MPSAQGQGGAGGQRPGDGALAVWGVGRGLAEGRRAGQPIMGKRDKPGGGAAGRTWWSRRGREELTEERFEGHW